MFCRSCFIRWSCAAGCASSSRLAGGAGAPESMVDGFRDAPRGVLVLEGFRDLLTGDIVLQAGGLLQKNFGPVGPAAHVGHITQAQRPLTLQIAPAHTDNQNVTP